MDAAVRTRLMLRALKIKRFFTMHESQSALSAQKSITFKLAINIHLLLHPEAA
jgi:hypothetical protein